MSVGESQLERPSETELLSQQLQELTDAHVEISDQMLALYQLTEFSAASLDPETAANRTVDQATSLLEADWTAFLQGGADEALVLAAETNAVKSLDTGGHLVLVDTATHLSDDRQPYVSSDEISGRSILGVPVDADDSRFGMLVAASRPGRQFDTTQVKLAKAIANQLAVMLKLSNMHTEAVKRSLTERDYDIASTVAQAALKRPMPDVAGLELAAFNRPARAAGGDFYAAVRSDNGIFAALGDVSGKGLPAALIMSTAITATYGAFERARSGNTAAVLSEIDHQMWSHLNETGMFITLAVVHIDLDNQVLNVSNAGHSPALRHASGALEHCPADGPPIGVLENGNYGQTSWDFEPGDLLFLGSDGWTDQVDGTGEMFGEDRLADQLLARTGNPVDLIDHLVNMVDHYADGQDQVDDLTALIVWSN